MTEFHSQREELLASLRSYASVAKQKNDALAELSRAGDEIRSALERDPHPNIKEILKRREQGYRRYAALCEADESDGSTLIGNARSSATDASDELNKLARVVQILQMNSRTLAEGILSCQNECESILKDRLAAVGKAIRESKQRRKLDAAYGPACRHDIPIYLDKHR